MLNMQYMTVSVIKAQPYANSPVIGSVTTDTEKTVHMNTK